MISNYINVLKKTKNQLINKSYINKIDKIKNSKKKNYITNNFYDLGFKVFKNSLDKELIDLIIHLKNSQNEKLIKNVYFPIFDKLKYIFDDISNDVDLSNFVLFSLNFLEANPKIKSDVSSYWHTDNLGSKINIFFCYEGYGNCPTLFIPGSHLKPYKPNPFENLRYMNFNKKKEIDNMVKINHCTSDISVFDANGLHRGAYELMNDQRPRNSLVFQLIDKHKIFHLGYKENPKFLNIVNTKPPFRKSIVKENQVWNIENEIFNKLMKLNLFDKELILNKYK